MTAFVFAGISLIDPVVCRLHCPDDINRINNPPNSCETGRLPRLLLFYPPTRGYSMYYSRRVLSCFYQWGNGIVFEIALWIYL